jgi:hypothetical protein
MSVWTSLVAQFGNAAVEAKPAPQNEWTAEGDLRATSRP